MTEKSGTTHNPVKEVRQVFDLTQEQMAEKLGCSVVTVRRWESKNILPRDHQTALAELRRMAGRVGIKIEP